MKCQRRWLGQIILVYYNNGQGGRHGGRAPIAGQPHSHHRPSYVAIARPNSVNRVSTRRQGCESVFQPAPLLHPSKSSHCLPISGHTFGKLYFMNAFYCATQTHSPIYLLHVEGRFFLGAMPGPF